MKRLFLLTHFLFLATCWGRGAVGSERPNIVLVMCDDLGWGDVGFNGNQVIQTPQLDAMAAAGLNFHRFYAQAPVCSPTRGSCVTGRHPYRYGIPFANSGHMKPEERTLAELLGSLDYVTGHFGKWHLGTLTKTVRDSNRGGPQASQHFSPPQANGFQVCFSTEAKVPTYDPMWKPADQAGSAWDAIRDRTRAVAYGTHYWDQRGQIVSDNLDGDNSRVIMDRAIPFIRQAVANDQPFFAVIWFHTPHLPVVAGPKHQQQYREYANVRRRNYYGCITAMDEQVGRLREDLRDLDVAENTMLWFCSDNGPEGNSNVPGSAGPFRGRKRSLYEGGIRVPGLLEWPGQVEPGSVTDFPAVTSDYLPTILAALGIEPTDTRPIDGISLLPMLAGQQGERPRPIGFQSRGQLALSGQRYKLVGNENRKAWELYDLQRDPGERSNIAEQQPERVQAMVATLETWQLSCQESAQGADYR